MDTCKTYRSQIALSFVLIGLLHILDLPRRNWLCMGRLLLHIKLHRCANQRYLKKNIKCANALFFYGSRPAIAELSRREVRQLRPNAFRAKTGAGVQP